ncbi:Aminopeptidase YwaD precursor [Polystyrenella longa]|uniref:Aminopeptidase YwaD n=1 Tax=Polystyrenella longa TaxID=2528007 RepID=A0A518CIB2_9PLAN|nr:M28 family peptidase [Polystyrenella longa]QDU78947.1 Aminopeptidase YwaD precursor [Polystyrenella longa]
MLTDATLLFEHLDQLCRTPRPAMSGELETARQYVENQLIAAGWNCERQPFEAQNSMLESLNGINIVARHPALQSAASDQKNFPTLVVGAHLDSREETPGADDNASAVVTLLEIARVIPQLIADQKLACDLELVAFDLEENGMLGGAWHAAIARQTNRNLAGMISLEMLGYCDPKPGSQKLPEPLIGLYPDTGDFIAIIGNQVSTSLISNWRQGMEQVEGLPIQSLQVPNNGNDLQASRLSDHSPFWDEGFAALMITDTSFLRNPYYHLATDTPETLDRDFLHKVAEGSTLAISHILKSGL